MLFVVADQSLTAWIFYWTTEFLSHELMCPRHSFFLITYTYLHWFWNLFPSCAYWERFRYSSSGLPELCHKSLFCPGTEWKTLLPGFHSRYSSWKSWRLPMHWSVQRIGRQAKSSSVTFLIAISGIDFGFMNLRVLLSRVYFQNILGNRQLVEQIINFC